MSGCGYWVAGQGGRAGQGRARARARAAQGRAGQGSRAGQGRAGQGRAGQGRAGHQSTKAQGARDKAGGKGAGAARVLKFASLGLPDPLGVPPRPPQPDANASMVVGLRS